MSDCNDCMLNQIVGLEARIKQLAEDNARLFDSLQTITTQVGQATAIPLEMATIYSDAVQTLEELSQIRA